MERCRCPAPPLHEPSYQRILVEMWRVSGPRGEPGSSPQVLHLQPGVQTWLLAPTLPRKEVAIAVWKPKLGEGENFDGAPGQADEERTAPGLGAAREGCARPQALPRG